MSFPALKWKAPKSRQSPFSPCDLKTSSISPGVRGWSQLFDGTHLSTDGVEGSAFPEPQHFSSSVPSLQCLGTLHSKWLFSAMFSHSLSFLFLNTSHWKSKLQSSLCEALLSGQKEQEHVSAVHSCLWANYIPFYGYTTICVSSQQWRDIRVIWTFRLL